MPEQPRPRTPSSQKDTSMTASPELAPAPGPILQASPELLR
ncbi:flavin reductase, partial [Streptomyces cavourensis]